MEEDEHRNVQEEWHHNALKNEIRAIEQGLTGSINFSPMFLGNGSGQNNALVTVQNTNSGGDSRVVLKNESNNARLILQMANTNYGGGSSPSAAFATEGSLSNFSFVTNADLASGGSTPVQFKLGGYSVTPQMTLLANGNLGLGVTSPVTQMQVGLAGALQTNTLDFNVGGNVYNAGSGWKYVNTAFGTLINMAGSDGAIRFYTAPSGTGGAAATITQRMILNNSGYLRTRPEQFMATSELCASRTAACATSRNITVIRRLCRRGHKCRVGRCCIRVRA